MKKMLIIDDNMTFRDLLAADFENDFILLTAANGMEGLSAAHTAFPDIILLDIDMPDISGVEVMRALASRPETKDIPVVVITAGEFNAVTERQLRTYKNFEGFLSKMSPIEVIRKIVHHALR